MTPKDFRRIALSMSGAIESEHMGHPDFRANGKIFASLGWPDKNWGMVKLSPEEQARFVQDNSEALKPVEGGWGKNGSTQVHLASVDEPTLRNAIVAAWSRAVTMARAVKSRKSVK
jgi:hypothetical protein